MNSFAFFFLLIVIPQISHAQNILIKKDGETIPYNQKMKFIGDSVQILDEEGDKVRIRESDVAAYFDAFTRLIYFQKPYDPFDPYPPVFPSRKESFKYEYMPMKEAGKISVFERIEYSPPYKSDNGAVTTSSATFYYAQKGNYFGHAFRVVNYLDRKKVRDTMKSFLDDDPEILAKLDSKDFQYNRKHFFKLIREYNVKHFTPPTAAEYRSLSNVSIYANAVPKLRSKIKITVNDSLEFTMPDGNFPLPVALPNNVVSKVCVTLQSVSYCRTLSPCPYALHYYEAEITSGGKPIDLEFRSEEEYLSYLTKTH